MFEADSQLKLLPPSILDIYTVFEHIDMLSIHVVNWHTEAALNSYTDTPWRHLPPHPHCCPRSAGISSSHIDVVTCTGIVTFFVLASLPSLCWCCHPCWMGLLPLLRWCCHYMRHGLPRRPHLSTCQLNKGKDACKLTSLCKHNKGKEACITRALMPAHQGQQHQ
jgi:hypothetical protein